MIRPTRRAIVLAGAGFPIALLPALVGPSLWVAWVGYNAVLLALSALDTVLMTPARKAKVRIQMPGAMYLNHDADLRVQVRVPGAREGTLVETRCDIEGPVDADDAVAMQLDDEGRAAGRFALSPVRRGNVQCPTTWLRWRGPFGLVANVKRVESDAEVGIQPDIHAVKQAALQMTRRRNFLAGLKRQRYIGDGTEFESLREYQPGYDHRAIDWKASARQRKLLVREYQAERNHRIILAFDTGYLMSQTLEGTPRLDHAIKAGLLLALLSLRQGDRVGVFGFDSEVRLWIAPQAGMPTLQRLMQQSSRLGYHPVETNFTRGLAELNSRLRRRSIVVVLTDFADTITAEHMVNNLGQLARRHLVIFVSLRDREITRIARAEPREYEDVGRAVVAEDFVRDRDIVLTRLRRRGIFCIDAAPDEITVQLLNRYLEVKRRGLI